MKAAGIGGRDGTGAAWVVLLVSTVSGEGFRMHQRIDRAAGKADEMGRRGGVFIGFLRYLRKSWDVGIQRRAAGK